MDHKKAGTAGRKTQEKQRVNACERERIISGASKKRQNGENPILQFTFQKTKMFSAEEQEFLYRVLLIDFADHSFSLRCSRKNEKAYRLAGGQWGEMLKFSYH